MKILFDTNIILDVLLARSPFATEASQLWQAHDEAQIDGFLCATTLTDVYYVIRRHADLDRARKAIRTCLATFSICPVDRTALILAEALGGSDFEDNLQVVCAQQQSLDGLVTRDKQGFKQATLPILTPTELLARLDEFGETTHE